MRRTDRGSVLFFVLSACALALAAQTDPATAHSLTPQPEGDPITLPPWLVEVRVDAHTAPARDDSFASTFGSTAMTGDKAWSGRNLSTLSETLRRMPGLLLQESFGGFEPPRFIIRGSGLDSAPTSRGVAFLLDGLSFARADGSFHSGLLDPMLFPRIEVYRGTLHAALTPAALGGVLNAVPAPMGTSTSQLRLQTGSFGAWRGQLSDAVTLAGVPVQVAASHQHQEGYRPLSAQTRSAALVRVQHLSAAERQWETSVYFANPRYEVPGPLTLTQALEKPRSNFAAVVRDQPRRDSSLLRVATQFKQGTPEAATAAGLAWQHWRDDFRQLQPNGETLATGDDLNGQVTLSRRISFGSLEHHLLARAVFSIGTTQQDRFLNNLGSRGTRFGANDLEAQTLALSLEDIVWLRPNLAVGAGLTLLQSQRKIIDRLTPTSVSGELSRTFRYADVSPRFGVQWFVQPEVSVYAAWSRGAEPPVFDDLLSVQGTHPNLTLRQRELEAQHATTAELGLRGRTGPLSWNVTAYHAWWRHEILRLADAAGLPRGAVNASATRHQGIEAALRWRLLESPHRVTLSTTANWSRFNFAHDAVYGQNRLAGAPAQLGNADLLYEHPAGWYAGIEANWISGRTPVDHANQLFYDGHLRWDARLGWKFRTGVSVVVSGHNLFDRHYIASTAGVLDLARNPAATTIFLPGNGRGITCGMEYTW